MTAHDLRDIYSSGSLWERILAAFLSAPIFLVSALALMVIASTVYAVVLRRCAGASQALDVRILGGSVFFGVFLATLATGRADMNHLLYLTPLFMYLVPSVLDIKHHSVRFLYPARPLIACILLVSFAGFGLITVLKAAAPATKTKTRRGVVRLAYPDEVLAYVEKNGNEGQQMYVHPYQALYSFLCGTVNPTHINFLQPGMSTADQYEATVDDLAANRTPVVLFDPNFADKISATWPSTPAEALAKDPVADYLLRHYSVCQFLNSNPRREWSFYYMVRNDLACPAVRSGPDK
jgi:hypothetical protein